MRVETITRTLYAFDELPEAAQEKAIDRLYSLNVDHEWWEFQYEDAERVGLKITGFDIDRGNYCKAHFTLSPGRVAAKIIKEHGPKCETVTRAHEYLAAVSGLDPDAPEHDDASDEFLRALREEYLSMLRKEYEYLTSREAIVESIQANNYEFTEDGRLA